MSLLRKIDARAASLLGALLLLLSAGCAGDGSGAAPSAAPAVSAGPVAMKRLTEAQYRATVADVLGADIEIAGRIEPDNRRSGLFAVGASFVSVTPSGFEEYDLIARDIAAQVVDPEHRASLPCAPAAADTPDDACATQIVRALGRRLLRRPLNETDVAPRVAMARDAAAALGDFYAGLESALSSLLLSPEFLFRIERAEADPNDSSRQRLDSVSMASRLSYFLWNTTPDAELLAAAERGDLVDDELLAAQVDRLLASPRLADSVRAFFADLYGFSDIEQGLVRKDPALFPAFSQEMINDAREQTLRVITAHLLDADGDYRELFTTRRSFMTRALGLVYRVPVPQASGWQEYDFPEDSPRAGLLTHVSLLALYSHPGRSSPTLRGKFVREVLLCQDVPPPPGDVDFSQFADDRAGTLPTARDRLAVHVANEACAGCHSLMDPIGLGLENLDGIGIFRTEENGALIDASGQLDGVAFANAVDLGRVLSQDPALGPCFVDTLFKYAVGRDPVAGENEYLSYLKEQAARSGYRMRAILRQIALSDAFRTTSGSRVAEPTPTPAEIPQETPTPASAATATAVVSTSPAASPPPTGAATAQPSATPIGTAPRATASPTATVVAYTFAQLQAQVFTPVCATQFCHSRQTRSANLVLEAGDAYDDLVGATPTNSAAVAAGLLRVDPFNPDGSYLLVKLRGPNEVALGARMPLIGSALSAEEIELIRGWIAAGAQP